MYCLMLNDFHLVVETPNANLVAGMCWCLSTSTARFNRRHKVFGHLFSGRYKSLIVDGSGNGYLRTVCVSLEKGIRHLGKRENQMVAWGLAAGKGMVRRRAVERYPPHRRL